MITGLDHVQVAAPPGCEAAARAFYGVALGLPELEKPEPLRAAGGAWFACGPQQLHVGVAEPFAPATKGHPALMTASPAALRTLARRLEAAGHAPRWDDRLPGYVRFYCDDPWGNRVELLARPAPAEDGERPER